MTFVDVPELTHTDCGNPLTINPWAGPDDTPDSRCWFFCRHCDGMPLQMPDGTTPELPIRVDCTRPLDEQLTGEQLTRVTTWARDNECNDCGWSHTPDMECMPVAETERFQIDTANRANRRSHHRTGGSATRKDPRHDQPR
jgi:hypothetical protein